MAQAFVSFRMNPELKKEMEQTCEKMGLTMTAAFTMFAKTVVAEQRIPFEVTVREPSVTSQDERLPK